MPASDGRCGCLLFAYVREFSNRSLPKLLFPQTQYFTGEACKQLQRRMIGPIGEELANPGMLDSLGTIWGKLYRRDILDGTSFVDLKIIGTAEDSLFNCNVFRKVQKAVYINKAFYHYRKFNSGAETKNISLNYFSNGINCLITCKQLPLIKSVKKL